MNRIVDSLGTVKPPTRISDVQLYSATESQEVIRQFTVATERRETPNTACSDGTLD